MQMPKYYLVARGTNQVSTFPSLRNIKTGK